MGGEWLDAGRILIATGAPAASAMLQATPVRALLSRILHSSATIFALGFRRSELPEPPRGFGFLVPRRERRTVMAATWVTNKFPHRAPPGDMIVRCFVPGDHHETLLEDVRADFARITGIHAKPWFTRVHRWPDSMPQYAVGHSRLIQEIEAVLPARVQLAGAYLRGVGMPDCVKSGVESASPISAESGAGQ